MNIVEICGKSHPDKMADQIANLVRNYALKAEEDEIGKVDVVVTPSEVYITGSIHSIKLGKMRKDLEKAIVSLMVENKYKKPRKINICFNTISYTLNADTSDALITCYGYATNETTNTQPVAYNMARALENCIEQANSISVSANGMCQIVTNNKNKITRIVVNHKSKNPYDFEKVVDNILNNVVVDFGLGSTTFKQYMDKECKTFVNPNKHVDYNVGVSGRRMASDTYGGLYHTPTESMSGKFLNDFTFAGPLFAKKLAKSIVDEKIANECEIRISFVPGSSEVADIECTYCDNGEYDKINATLKTKKFNTTSIIEELKKDYNSKKINGAYGYFD